MGKYDFDLNLVYPDSVLKILEQIKTGSAVLEFGPANGRMTRYMKNELDCHVYLAELDEEAGKEALQYGVDLVVGDIENFEWYHRYRDLRFDYILFADVLEHLRDPLEVLIKSKMLLKTDGSILLSVPNLSHNSVMINLLNHEFDYRDVGLLDNTHIHFFTKNSLEKMLRQACLYPVRKMATYRATSETEIAADPDSVAGLSRSFWNTRPYGEVYQFVYQVKKDSEWSGQVEYDCKSVRNADAIKIYRSDGNGYSEEYTVTKYIYNYETDNQVIVKIKPGEKSLRVDPTEQSGIIKLVSCTGIAGDRRIPLKVSAHNAGFVSGNVYYFETTDPQWQIEIPSEADPVREAEIVVSFIALLDCGKMHKIIESLAGTEEMRSLEYVRELEKLLEEKDSLIQDIYHSTTWRWNRRINRLLGRKI